MARLWVTRDETPDPVVAAYQAARQALVVKIVDERSDVLRRRVEAFDGGHDLVVEGGVEHVVNLLLTLRHHKCVGHNVGPESEEELAALECEAPGFFGLYVDADLLDINLSDEVPYAGAEGGR